MSELLLDRAGRRRSPATMPGFRAGHAPGNKGLRYPADPPKVEEIIAVMRTAGDAAHGRRLRGLIVITGRPRRHVPSCGARPPRPECDAASRHTSSDTPTPSRWPAKASR
jgi:hypothetical protein